MAIETGQLSDDSFFESISVGKKDSAYPQILKDISESPEKICIMGHPRRFDPELTVTLLANDNPSFDALLLAKAISKNLFKNEYQILTGANPNLIRAVSKAPDRFCPRSTVLVPRNTLQTLSSDNEALLMDLIHKKGTIFSYEKPVSVKNQNHGNLIYFLKLIDALSDCVVLLDCALNHPMLNLLSNRIVSFRNLAAIAWPYRSELFSGNHHLLDLHLAESIYLPDWSEQLLSFCRDKTLHRDDPPQPELAF